MTLLLHTFLFFVYLQEIAFTIPYIYSPPSPYIGLVSNGFPLQIQIAERSVNVYFLSKHQMPVPDQIYDCQC